MNSERDFPFEVKTVNAEGVFEGLAATFAVDQGGDLIVRGAFERTLRERGEWRPVLWQHDPTQPVGLGELKESDAGLEVRGRLDLDVQAGRDAFSRLKKKIVRGLSIGYRSLPDKVRFENGVRQLLDIDLYEISLVVFPMNSGATVTAVKSFEIRAFERLLHDAGVPKSEAKRLASATRRGLGMEEAEPAADELLEFFREQRACSRQ